MRKGRFFAVFLAGIVLTASQSFAQKTVNEAVLTYTISIESSSENAPMSKPLNGATRTVYLKGTQSRTDMVSALCT